MVYSYLLSVVGVAMPGTDTNESWDYSGGCILNYLPYSTDLFKTLRQ